MELRMNHAIHIRRFAVAAATIGGIVSSMAYAAVPASEAEQLKTTLTPFGAEKAGNKAGTIPAWTGGYTTPLPASKGGARRGDPFGAEQPLYSITAKNMEAHADKLTDGTKAMFAKYPATFRVDVYPTHRTAAAPQWLYANTLRNATRAKLVETPTGSLVQGADAGIPFPLPKSGAEVLWNHLLRWRGTGMEIDLQGYLLTADGKRVLTVDATADMSFPYYHDKDTPSEGFEGDHTLFRMINSGPPIRAGEGLVSRMRVNNEEQTWLYLAGQRRVRRLPNACCDTPTPATAGVMSIDEVDIFMGPNGRFDWKLIGKKEMLIPYNSNALMTNKSSEVFGTNHISPDVMRWELHRVWVVEATLRAGQRHEAPRGLYYFDEDTWNGVLADRWNASGRLWKTLWMASFVMPEVPATMTATFGYYDLLSGTAYTHMFVGDKARQFRFVNKIRDTVFTPDGLVGEGLR